MFATEFEKIATKKDLGKAVGGIAKSVLEGAKGVGHGAVYQAKRSADKMKEIVPEFKKNWKGVKNPKSYKAVTQLLAKSAPEIAVGYAGYRVGKRILDPNDQPGATLGYY